jgi:uncharacterized protein YkwD
MSKRGRFPISAIVFLLLVLLAACTIEPVDIPSTPASSPSPLSTVALTHSSLLTTPTPIPTPPPNPTLTPTPPLPTEPVPTTHTVQTGDTLLGLASQYNVPIAAIQLQNGLGESTILHAGETLVIPPQAGWEDASPFWVVYVVKAGETLAKIARTYGVEVEALQAINGLDDAGRIQVGQELVLPLNAPATALVPTPTPTPLPTPTLTPHPPPIAEPPPPTAVPAIPPPADIAAWPRETVRLINEVRAQHGLGPLAYNETLAQAAQAHANDCQQRGWCSHTGSDGADIKTRILRAGYTPTGWAECWAQSRSPQHAVDMWMDEVPPDDAHRRTLLTTWLTEIGVGVAQTDWGYYFIADFGRP